MVMPWVGNVSKNRKNLGAVFIAKSWYARLKGMLSAHKEAHPPAYYFPSCHAIHTIGMKIAIDVVFLDRMFKVRKIHWNVHPGKWWVGCWGADSVLEFPVGSIKAEDVAVGDQLEFIESEGGKG